mmetsp:Transcript_37158/g.61248  ORF Transcript_37158/g.61248 Transcript_37158/m.61248 type:complete len:200 (-) Transcript_37158:152-751(-)
MSWLLLQSMMKHSAQVRQLLLQHMATHLAWGNLLHLPLNLLQVDPQILQCMVRRWLKWSLMRCLQVGRPLLQRIVKHPQRHLPRMGPPLLRRMVKHRLKHLPTHLPQMGPPPLQELLLLQEQLLQHTRSRQQHLLLRLPQVAPLFLHRMVKLSPMMHLQRLQLPLMQLLPRKLQHLLHTNPLQQLTRHPSLKTQWHASI